MWHNVWSADNLVEVLNEHLLVLVGLYVPTKVIRVRTRVGLGLMSNAGMLLDSSRWLVCSGPMIALGLIEKSLFEKSLGMKPTRRTSVSFVSETEMFS